MFADHDVVEYPDIHQRQGLLQAGRDGAISGARLQIVIVGMDYGGCVVPQGGADDFTGVHFGTIHGAAEQCRRIFSTGVTKIPIRLSGTTYRNDIGIEPQ